MLRLSRRRASEAFSPLGLDLGASRPPDLRRGLSGTSATRGSPSAWRSPGPLRAGYPGVLSATSPVMLPLASPTGNTVGLGEPIGATASDATERCLDRHGQMVA